MRLPDASSPVQPATSAWTPSPARFERDVAGATDRRGLATETHDRYRRFGRDPRDFADEVAVEHEVADDEHPRAGEAAAHAGVDEVRPVKHRAPHPPSRASTRLHSSCPRKRCASWIRGVTVLGTTSAASATNATLPPSPRRDADGERAASSCAASRPRTTFALVARGGEPDRDVTGAAERLELAGEDVVERAVVRDRGEQRAVGGQRDRREAGAVDEVAADELGREVLALRRAAAVAEPEDRAAGAQGLAIIRSATRSTSGTSARERRHDYLVVVDSLLDVHETSLDGRCCCA